VGAVPGGGVPAVRREFFFLKSFFFLVFGFFFSFLSLTSQQKPKISKKTKPFQQQQQLNSFFLKAALWVPQLNPLTLYRLVGFFLLGLPAFKEFYRFVVAGEERKAEEEERRRKNLSREEMKLLPPLPSNRLGPCAWLMLAIIATETLVAVKFGPSLLLVAAAKGGGSGSGSGGSGGSGSGGNVKGLPSSVFRAWSVFGVAAAGLAGSWLWPRD